MSSNVQIFLENYNGACYPGQTIAGRIDCTFDKQKNLRAVRIKFRGRAKTRWTESESHYDSTTKKHKTRRVTYTAEEDYFNAEYALVQGGDNFSLSAGKHSYPFSYILPQQLPSSFEGDHGNIRYSVKATVDRPWKFDYEAYISLNLVSPLDLNYVPRVREPAASSVDKTVCCFCCKSGPITFDISVPATGYAPGQEVNVGAYVQNMSNVSAERVAFKIVKDLQFITHHPSTKRKYSEHVVIECGEGGIGAHGEKSWTSVLKIPINESFPNLTPCSIINISYRLKAKVVLPSPHTNLDTELSFVIGNVPLTGLNTTIPGPPPSIEFPLPNYNALPTPFPPQPGATAPRPEATPLLSNPTAPYPAGDTKSFPTDSAPYPSAPGAPTYPSYPPAAPTSPSQVTPNVPGGTPYPSGSAPYPSAGAPYPSGGVPYPSGGAPYPSGGAPYPPAGGATPYQPGGSTPYPPAGGSAPYPSGEVSYPSAEKGYPPTSGWTQPAQDKGSEAASAPPSYDEAKKLNEKDGKPE